MRDHEPPHTESDMNAVTMFRLLASLTLLFFGICAAIWVLVMVASAIGAEYPPGIVTAITTNDGNPLKATLDGKVLEVPNQLMLVPAYFCLCVLLIVAASIAKGAISGGISLLLAGKRK